MPESLLEAVATGFKANAQSVYELLEFDDVVLDHVVGGLTTLATELEQQGRNLAAQTVTNRVTTVRNIRHSESLKPRYATMYNQCVVLLVSYFGSAVHTLFLEAVAAGLRRAVGVPAAKQKVEFAWADLSAGEGSMEAAFANLLAAQRDISFQDMQSITRAFKDHLAIELEQDDVTNDIIVGQACRHAIVHAGGVVDPRLVRQVGKALPRGLKPDFTVGDHIRFDPSEVRQLGGRMQAYIDRLAVVASAKVGAP